MSNNSFPLRIIEQLNTKDGTSCGRRGIGTTVGKGVYRFGRNASTGIQVDVNGDPSNNALITAQLCENALNQLFSRLKDDSSFKGVFDKLAEHELTAVFMESHEYLMDLNSNANVLFVSCDLVMPLGYADAHFRAASTKAKAEGQRGFEYLLLLAHCHLLLRWLGWTQRQALAKVVELYAAFSKAERDCLHGLLEGSILDSGNLFSMFLKRVTIDSPNGIKNRQQLVWQDQQITWLLGQDRFDLPYERQAAVDILQTSADLDEQRSQLYRLLRGYNRPLERGNIERISTEVHEARQQLIFGRMSRAFHNQATLFANSALLTPSLAWRQLAAELTALAKATPGLQASAGVLALLLTSSKEISLTTLEGACELFEAAILDEQKTALSNALEASQSSVEDYNDPLTGSFAGVVSHEAIMALAGRGLRLVENIRKEFLFTARRHAAYVVISQRPSPTGSHLLIKINEFKDPYSGKAENLRKLTRLAGDRIYSSPDYGWLTVADHWIEAIPLFIKEEVLVQEGQEITRTVIDISGMEVSFREEMADLWACNLRQVLESEFLALAREIISAGKFTDLDEDGLRKHLQQESDSDEIAAVAVLIGEIYRLKVNQVQKLIEAEGLVPFDAMRQILLANENLRQLEEHHQVTNSWATSVKQILQSSDFSKNVDREVSRLKPQAFKPRRLLPTLHVLTTQSAGMTDGYIRTWLEESMALFNIAEDLGLHEKIAECEEFFTARIVGLGEKIIRELGVWIEVEELCASEQIPQTAAVLRLINRNRQIQDELSCLGALLEFDETKHGRKKAEDCDDPIAVEEYFSRHTGVLQEAALTQVISRNHEALISQIGGECFR